MYLYKIIRQYRKKFEVLSKIWDYLKENVCKLFGKILAEIMILLRSFRKILYESKKINYEVGSRCLRD